MCFTSQKLARGDILWLSPGGWHIRLWPQHEPCRARSLVLPFLLSLALSVYFSLLLSPALILQLSLLVCTATAYAS